MSQLTYKEFNRAYLDRCLGNLLPKIEVHPESKEQLNEVYKQLIPGYDPKKNPFNQFWFKGIRIEFNPEVPKGKIRMSPTWNPEDVHIRQSVMDVYGLLPGRPELPGVVEFDLPEAPIPTSFPEALCQNPTCGKSYWVGEKNRPPSLAIWRRKPEATLESNWEFLCGRCIGVWKAYYRINPAEVTAPDGLKYLEDISEATKSKVEMYCYAETGGRTYTGFKLEGAHFGPAIHIYLVNARIERDEDSVGWTWDKVVWDRASNIEFKTEEGWLEDAYFDAIREELNKG